MSSAGHADTGAREGAVIMTKESGETTLSNQAGVSGSSPTWRLHAFAEFDAATLYRVLSARMAVFVVEQACPYQDIDGLDAEALHLSGWSADGELAAYARLLPPGTRFGPPSIGRVLTTTGHRRRGLGRELMRRAIATAHDRWPGMDIRISAQCYLEPFYADLGFRVETEPYDEDGIPHIDMRLPPPA